MNAGLGRSIVDLPDLPALTIYRPDIDDAPPFAFAHSGEYRFRHVKASRQVDTDDLVPLFKRHFDHRRIARDTGIVDHDIDRAKLGFNRSARIDARRVIAHIPFADGNAGAVGKFLGGSVIAAIIGDDKATLFFQFQADRLTNAPRPPGYNRYT